MTTSEFIAWKQEQERVAARRHRAQAQTTAAALAVYDRVTSRVVESEDGMRPVFFGECERDAYAAALVYLAKLFAVTEPGTIEHGTQDE